MSESDKAQQDKATIPILYGDLPSAITATENMCAKILHVHALRLLLFIQQRDSSDGGLVFLHWRDGF